MTARTIQPIQHIEDIRNFQVTPEKNFTPQEVVKPDDSELAGSAATPNEVEDPETEEKTEEDTETEEKPVAKSAAKKASGSRKQAASKS